MGKNILRTETSQIPFVDRNIYCRPFTGIPETAWVRLPGGKEYIDVVSDIYRWQVLVTYTHKTAWNGFKPESRLEQLSKSIKSSVQLETFNLFSMAIALLPAGSQATVTSMLLIW